MARKLLTQKEYAKKVGKSANWINKLVQRGVIQLVGRKIDPAQADRARREHETRSAKTVKKAAKKKAARVPRRLRAVTSGPKRKPEDTKAYWDKEHTRLKAQAAEIELQRAMGELLPREQMLKAEQAKNANIRMQFRRLPRNLAPMLARLASAADIEALLLEEIDRVLVQLAGDPLGESSHAAEATVPVAEVETMPEPIPVVPNIEQGIEVQQ